MASYSDSELQAIAAWPGDGLSASRIAAAFSAQRGSPVSRNAIIGVVHRNAMLGAIGFANGRGLSAAGTAMGRQGGEPSRQGGTPNEPCRRHPAAGEHTGRAATAFPARGWRAHC
ncbi:hypothetical protein [Mesorhizobium sp. URHB0026]